MAVKLTELTQKIATRLNLVAESCPIWSSRSRRPVRKLLDTLSHSRGYRIVLQLSLCLTMHHAMKMYRGSGGMAPGIFYFGTKWK